MNNPSIIDSFRNEYYFLSNFYEAPITFDGITYLNNEAAFQAQKVLSGRERFANLNPSEAKHLGRRVSLRPDWESVKVNLMRDIVRAKFAQNEDLREKLLNTGDAYLVEGNDWGDKIWGQVNGAGQNLLGQILMEVREELRNILNAMSTLENGIKPSAKKLEDFKAERLSKYENNN